MKKTLITLAALAMASVAQAGVLDSTANGGNLTLQDWDVVASESYSQVFSGTVTTDGGTSRAYTLTFAIDWNAAVNSVPSLSNKTLYQLSSKPSNYWKHAVDLGISDGTSITVALRSDTTGSDAWQEQGSATFDKNNYCVDGQLRLSVSYDGAKTFTLSAMKNDTAATIVSTEVTNFTSWTVSEDFGNLYIGTGLPGDVVDALLGFNKVLDEEELRVASKHIPEPTTATLSLLALAGLAARRRRK